MLTVIEKLFWVILSCFIYSCVLYLQCVLNGSRLKWPWGGCLEKENALTRLIMYKCPIKLIYCTYNGGYWCNIIINTFKLILPTILCFIMCGQLVFYLSVLLPEWPIIPVPPARHWWFTWGAHHPCAAGGINAASRATQVQHI